MKGLLVDFKNLKKNTRHTLKQHLNYWFNYEMIVNKHFLGDSVQTLFRLKPLSHQKEVPYRLYSVLKPVSALWGHRETRLKISNLPVIVCTGTQSPHSVPTASTQRSHSVFIASMKLLRRASSCCSVFMGCTRRSHSAHIAFSRHAHSVPTVTIAFKII